MPIKPITDENAKVHLHDMTRNGASTFLGKEDLYVRLGPHFVGFTSENSVIQARAAYDPCAETDNQAKDLLEQARYIGYTQYACLLFKGQPIPPKLFRGPLASFSPYAVHNSEYSTFEFVDFLGPGQVERPFDLHPFYAFNDMPLGWNGGNGDLTEFCSLNHITGALCSRNPGADDALAATMYRMVSLNQLQEADVRAVMRRAPMLHCADVTAQDPSIGSAVDLALLALGESAEESLWITFDDIVQCKIVGSLVLLYIDNFENENPILCIHFERPSHDRTELQVHLLQHEDMRGLEEDETVELLGRMSEFFDERGIVGMFPTAERKRGGRGLMGSLPQLEDGAALEMRFRTIAYAQLADGGHGAQPLSGFTWSAYWTLDAIGRVFELDEKIGTPQLLDAAALEECNAALAQFASVMADPAYKGATVDKSGYEPISMSSDFSGGGKRRKLFEEDE